MEGAGDEPRLLVSETEGERKMTEPTLPIVEPLAIDRKSERAVRIRAVSNKLIKMFRRENVSHDDSVSAMCNLLVASLEIAPQLTTARRLEAIDSYSRSMKQAIIANAERRKGLM